MDRFDKICVAPHQIYDNDLDIQEVGHNGAEEYIRKGELIEWAENWKKQDVVDIDMGADFLFAMEILVRHINSL